MTIPTEPIDLHAFDLGAFDLAGVAQAIAATEFAGHIQHYASTASTNALALDAAKAGARTGVWIADRQTAGRGRGSHAWHSAAGEGLYMTALIAPRIPIENSLGLSLTTAIAVQSAIASTFGFRIREQSDLRGPNDRLLTGKDGTARKCGGILIETASNAATSAQPATLRYAVIGIGINVNHLVFPDGLDPIATSLRRELPGAPGLASETWVHEPLRREPLAAAILLALELELHALTTNNGQRATNNGSRDLSRFSSWIDGKRVRVEARDPTPNDPAPGGYTGITAGLNRSGFLLVRGDDGLLHTVLSGGLREP